MVNMLMRTLLNLAGCASPVSPALLNATAEHFHFEALQRVRELEDGMVLA
jgi:hypothetical protein